MNTRALAVLIAVGVTLGVGVALFVRDDAAPGGQPVGAQAQPAPVETRSAPRPAPLDDSGEALNQALDAFLGEVKVDVAPGPQDVLDETLRQGKGPIDYRQALETSLRKRRGADLEAARLLKDGMGQVDEAYLFQHAQVLSHHASPETTSVLLEGLESAPARIRPHLVFALRGSNEPRVVERFLALYGEDEDPKVRATAGFVLGERGTRLDPQLVERARHTARADLRGDDPQLVESAADVLGIPPLDPNDRTVLIETARRDPSSTRRTAALRALASSGARVDELAPLLESLANDPSAGDELRDAARHLLQAGGR